MSFKGFDHDMVAHAVARGAVVVDMGRAGRQVTATLLCWRPNRARRTARVRFRTGGTASVPVEQVSLPEIAAPCVTPPQVEPRATPPPLPTRAATRGGGVADHERNTA